MQKKFSQGIGTLLAVLMGLTLAACTPSPDQMLPSPEETTHIMDYLVSQERAEVISDAYDRAEQQISEALEAGTLAADEATIDEVAGVKFVEISNIEGSRLRIEGPIKGDSIWVFVHDGLSSTVAVSRMYTATEVYDHDVAALKALEQFLADID